MDKEFLEILACPVCRGPFELKERDGKEELLCTKCHRAYPIEDGIPNLLPDSGVVRK
ncbi:MAG: Trm112 family protein [Acidobacteria bacterium]|nr:Trm112 family protein [Acidobacteriota bacterium]